MRIKRILIILIILILILSVGVSIVNGFSSNDGLDIKETLDSQIDNIKSFVGLEESHEIKNKHEVVSIEVNSYDEIKDAIEKYSFEAENKSVIINLNDGDYNITDTIKVGTYKAEQQYTLNGNGHIIDGQNQHQFMELFADLNLKNLKIQNTVAGESNASSAINMEKVSSLYVDNCSFVNNIGKNKGSSITNRGSTYIINSEFINNSVEENGGAIWSTGQYGGSLTIKNSLFKENSANIHENNERTAIIYMVASGNNTIENNEFKNNYGRCIHSFNKTNTQIINNIFTDNILKDNEVIRGGIIDNYESDIVIKNNEFDNDYTEGELRGGVLYHEIGKLEFINNKVNTVHVEYDPVTTSTCSKGGVIFNRNASVKIENNIFNNTMIGNLSRGGVIYNNLGEIDLRNNEFVNTLKGDYISGLTIFNDVNGHINVENNKFESKKIGIIEDKNISNEYIFNSKIPNDEGSGLIGITNYY